MLIHNFINWYRFQISCSHSFRIKIFFSFLGYLMVIIQFLFQTRVRAIVFFYLLPCYIRNYEQAVECILKPLF